MRPEVRDLLREFQEKIPEVVCSHIRQLILFGSAAWEEDQPESDVNILALLDEKLQETEEFLKKQPIKPYGHATSSASSRSRFLPWWSIRTAREGLLLLSERGARGDSSVRP